MTAETSPDAIADAVRADAEYLKSLTTHADLYRWARQRHLTGEHFSAVKHQFRTIGVDYDALRDQVARQRGQAQDPTEVS